MSSRANALKTLYLNGRISEAGLEAAKNQGLITEEELVEILACAPTRMMKED